MKKKQLNLKFLAAILLAAAVISSFAAAFGAFGGKSANAALGEEDFSFDSVRLEAVVHEDKTLDITETLVTVWSSGNKRSLIRDIQRDSKTTRVVNGKKIKGKNYFAKISDISATLDDGECDWHIIGKDDSFYLDDFYSIEMKQTDGSYFESGQPYTFVLKYKYDLGDDRLSKFDDLTFDIFGYDMNSTKEFSAKITFPEGASLSKDNVTVRSSKAGVLVGWQPIEGREKFLIDGNTVEIETLRRANGLTLQVILPKGTFTGGVTMYWYYWVFIAIAVAAVILMLVIFVKNLPIKPVEPVEFYPPEGVSVMKFSAIWHKTAKTSDAAALILKWADMGLITIEKDGSSHLILRKNNPERQNGFTGAVFDEFEEEKPVEKIAKDGKKYFDNSAERQYFNTLFSGIGGGLDVFSTKLFNSAGYSNQNKLYQATKKLTEGEDVKNVMAPSTKMRALVPMLGVAPAVAIVVYNCIISSQFVPMFFLIFIIVGTGVGAAFFSGGLSLLSLIILVVPVMFFGMPYLMFALTFAMPAYDYANLLIVAPVIWAVAVFILPNFMGRRTQEANVIYGRIRGFRHFLLTAELPRIQALFDENPEYFSDILPWCMILGISKKVQQRFAELREINMPKVIQDNIDVRFVSRCIMHSSYLGAPRSSGSGGGGGGGGHGGSHGGGGGGGGSRSR